MPAASGLEAVAVGQLEQPLLPRRNAESCASRSPSVAYGSRTFASISSYSGRTRRPPSTSRRAGNISPSW